MLNGVRTDISVRADRVTRIGVVISKECLHLGRLVDDSHDSEVILVVPSPRDVVVSSLYDY